jgi:hypothetical protein
VCRWTAHRDMARVRACLHGSCCRLHAQHAGTPKRTRLSASATSFGATPVATSCRAVDLYRAAHASIAPALYCGAPALMAPTRASRTASILHHHACTSGLACSRTTTCTTTIICAYVVCSTECSSTNNLCTTGCPAMGRAHRRACGLHACKLRTTQADHHPHPLSA